MLNLRNLSASAAITAIMALSTCGYDEQLVSITVAPAVVVRTANSNNNSVQFTAAGNYSVSCPPNSTTYSCNPSITKPLTNPTWSTSDAANTAIDAKGLATCVSPLRFRQKSLLRLRALTAL